MTYWNQAKEAAPDAKIGVVCCKSDHENAHDYDSEAFSQQDGFVFYKKTSAKDSEQVNKLFEEVAEVCYNERAYARNESDMEDSMLSMPER